MDYPGNLFVVSAPSGAGKSTLVKALLELWTALDNTWMYIDLKEGDFLLQEV